MTYTNAAGRARPRPGLPYLPPRPATPAAEAAAAVVARIETVLAAHPDPTGAPMPPDTSTIDASELDPTVSSLQVAPSSVISGRLIVPNTITANEIRLELGTDVPAGRYRIARFAVDFLDAEVFEDREVLEATFRHDLATAGGYPLGQHVTYTLGFLDWAIGARCLTVSCQALLPLPGEPSC